MLPFSNKKSVPAGPHAFHAETEIERSANEVYPLLDFADPRNAKRQLGDTVRPASGKPGSFELEMGILPDAIFRLKVTRELPNREYGFDCASEPLFGRVVRSNEHYSLEDLGEGRCRLSLTNTVHFDGRLHEQEFAMEAMMLDFSGRSALAKFKLHAEQGAEAVKEYERAQFGALDDLDWVND